MTTTMTAATATSPRERTGRASRPSRAEQETVIRWDREEPMASIWSANPAVWRKLARLGIAPHRETRYGGEVSGRFYRVPLVLFRWGLKRRSGHQTGEPPALARARVARSARSLQDHAATRGFSTLEP